jgi:ribosomal protein S18 acetylase RimI-like enzyme
MRADSPPVVELISMPRDYFDRWQALSWQTYAQDCVRSGRWSAHDAAAKAQESAARLLPQGFNTPGHSFYLIQVQGHGEPSGSIWVYVSPDPEGNLAAFIHNIEINQDERGKGIGRAALAALDQRMRAISVKSIGLHVFGHNYVARRLYETAGYEVTNLNMRKYL